MLCPCRWGKSWVSTGTSGHRERGAGTERGCHQPYLAEGLSAGRAAPLLAVLAALEEDA